MLILYLFPAIAIALVVLFLHPMGSPTQKLLYAPLSPFGLFYVCLRDSLMLFLRSGHPLDGLIFLVAWLPIITAPFGLFERKYEEE